MSATHGAAAHEEQTELGNLRAEADLSAAEVARTLTELTGRLAAGHPKALARQFAANARQTALRAVREVPGKVAGQRGAKRLALAAVPVLLLAAAAAFIVREKLRAED